MAVCQRSDGPSIASFLHFMYKVPGLLCNFESTPTRSHPLRLQYYSPFPFAIPFKFPELLDPQQPFATPILHVTPSPRRLLSQSILQQPPLIPVSTLNKQLPPPVQALGHLRRLSAVTVEKHHHRFPLLSPIQHQTMATIPEDMWVCGICRSGNLIALTADHCPVCGHERDYCCSGPGEPTPENTGQFSNYIQHHPSHYRHAHHFDSSPPSPTYHSGVSVRSLAMGFDDLWYCECGNENCDWCDFCPICGRSKPTESHLGTREPSTSSTGAGNPDPDAWICVNPDCGSSNSGFFDTHCGACGWAKP